MYYSTLKSGWFGINSIVVKVLRKSHLSRSDSACTWLAKKMDYFVVYYRQKNQWAPARMTAGFMA